MAIPTMALLQQHNAGRDIVTEPAARRRAAIETRGIPNWGFSVLLLHGNCYNTELFPDDAFDDSTETGQ